MANPNLKGRQWDQFKRYKHGVVPQAQAAAIAEDERRTPEDAPEPASPVPLVANPRPQASPPLPPNPPATPFDRFHKWGRSYVTVANTHYAGDDPVPDPAAYHTIAEGYAFAKTLAAREDNDYERITVWVSGGAYNEDLIFDDPRVDVVGIGRPLINGSVRIASDCTKILFDNFEIINADTPEDDDPTDFVGLYLEQGDESGEHLSDIQFKRLYLHGPKMQVHIRRWCDFDNCVSQSESNLSNGIPSIEVLFLLTDAFLPMSKFITFRNDCRISGQAPPNPGRLNPKLIPDYFARGGALRISVVNPSSGDWVVNVTTAASGVFLKNCTLSGYCENYGWNLRFDHCTHIEGYRLNTTAGSIHCLCYANTLIETVIDSFTWFDYSRFTSRYIACGIDKGFGGQALTKIWVRHVVHAGIENAQPPIVAGSDIIDGGNLVPPQAVPGVLVFAADYSTSANFIYNGGGAVELATVSNVRVGANPKIFGQSVGTTIDTDWEDM